VVRRLAQVGVADGLAIATRKPDWLRPKVVHGPEVIALRKTVRDHGLVTVCEEAGCPNLSDCWADGTATFMVLGERCTRACGFCLVDTQKPLQPADDEPRRVADAIAAMGLAHAVLTMVARDDLPDGGMAHVARCVLAIREQCPDARVETLISDAKGDAASLEVAVRGAARCL
jgi:lipoic acid synthetase